MYENMFYFMLKSFNLLVFFFELLFILFKCFNFKACYGFRIIEFSFPSAGHDSPDWVVTKLVSEPRFRVV